MRWQKCWRVVGLGQLQPVLFGWEHGGVTLRIEGVADRGGEPTWCWWRLPLRTCKARAKAAFAELERHMAAGTESPAARLWREHQKKSARVSA
jgi:hypothetical protein